MPNSCLKSCVGLWFVGSLLIFGCSNEPAATTPTSSLGIAADPAPHAAQPTVTPPATPVTTPAATTDTRPIEPPTPAVTGLAAQLSPQMREHFIALSQLKGEIEFGVGDRIISIDLDGTKATDADIVHIAALPDVKSLNLANTAITDAGLKELGKLKKLKFLYLFNTAVTDAGAAHLQALPRLEVLCLDQTQITDIGLRSLEELPRLEKLHVHSNSPITDAGLESLKKHTRLFELRVGGSGITEKGLAALKAALPDCNVVYDPQAAAKSD